MNDFVIETKQLTKIYGEQTAVSKVNLHVKKGRIYGLLGRNGAGKYSPFLYHIDICPLRIFLNEHEHISTPDLFNCGYHHARQRYSRACFFTDDKCSICIALYCCLGYCLYPAC